MKKSKEEAGWFGERQGLYAILLLGAVILAGVSYLLFGFSLNEADTETLSQYEYDSESSVATSDPVSDIPAISAQEDTTQETEADEAEDDEDDDEDDDDTAAESEQSTDESASDTAQPAQFAAPMDGAEVMRAYQIDSLSYDETMQDWRTHAATDYAGKKGDAVTAITDGTVVEVGKDALHGRYVILSHADNLQTLYAGITKVSVEEGDSVTCGQQIAKLGTAMPAEAEQGGHLHIEATRGEETVDVESLLGNS